MKVNVRYLCVVLLFFDQAQVNKYMSSHHGCSLLLSATGHCLSDEDSACQCPPPAVIMASDHRATGRARARLCGA